MAKCYCLFPWYHRRNFHKKSCLPNYWRLKKYDLRREFERPIRPGRKRSNDELRIRKRDKPKFPNPWPEQPSGPERTDAWKPNFQTTLRSSDRSADFWKPGADSWEGPFTDPAERESKIHLLHHQGNRTGKDRRLLQDALQRGNCQSTQFGCQHICLRFHFREYSPFEVLRGYNFLENTERGYEWEHLEIVSYNVHQGISCLIFPLLSAKRGKTITIVLIQRV